MRRMKKWYKYNIFLLKIGTQLENHTKKPYGSNGDSLSRVKDRTLSNAVLNRNKPTENKDPFGEAATLELTHDYVRKSGIY